MHSNKCAKNKGLCCAWCVGVLDVDVGVAAYVSEDPVHAEEGLTGADDGVLLVGHGVEEGDAATLLQHLVVSRSEQAVGQAVPAARRGKKPQFQTPSL